MFCLADVCSALGIQNHRNVKARLDEDDVRLVDTIDNLGRNQQVIFVNESGLYTVILRSDAEIAKPFRRWVTKELLPSIRKTGSYSIQNMSRKDLAMMVVRAEEEKERLALENERQRERMAADKPKVDYYDEVLTSTDTMTVTQIAKCLGRSGRWLNAKLRDCGLIYYQSGQWLLKSPYDRWRLHDVRPHKINHTDGTVGMRQSTVWTERGKRMIIALSRCGWKITTAIKMIRGEEDVAKRDTPAGEGREVTL